MAKPNPKYIDPYCDYCIKEGFVKGAAGFCPKCADFVCKSCMDNHGEQTGTDSHKILTGSAMPAKQSEKPLKYQSCNRHPLDLKDTYCLDHGQITCGKCALKDHKECDVKSILLAFKNFNIAAEDQAFKGTASHYLGHAQQLQMSVEENMNELEKQKNQLIQESQDFREQMTKQIRQSCDDFERKVLKNYMGQKKILAEKLMSITEIVTDIETALEDLQRQGVRTLGEARYFLHLKSNTETVLESADKLKEINDHLSYVDMTSQFYLCINPASLPQHKFVDATLQLSNYAYEKTVPDIYIPCINRPPDFDISTVSPGVDETDAVTWSQPSRRESAGDHHGASPSDDEDPMFITKSSSTTTKSEHPGVIRKDSAGGKDPASGEQTEKRNSQTFGVERKPSSSSSGSPVTSTSTDDQKLRGSLSKGDVTFRRLSLALEQSAKNLPSNVTMLDPIKLEIHGDESECLTMGLDITADGNVLIVDRNNRKLKMFSPDGDYMASRKLPKDPEGVAVISDNRAAVSTWNKLIGIVDTSPHGGLTLKKTINLGYHVWGIAGYRDHMIVTCSPSPSSTQSPSTVRMIDMHGKVKWSVTTDMEGADLFQWAGFLTVRSGASRDTVIVTDQYKQTITVLSAHNGSVLKVCDVNGRTPKGITCDENGEVYVCFDSGAITLWSADMSRERNPGNVDMKDPYAMAYDKKQKELFVASSSENSLYSNYVHRYHFRK